MGNAQVWGDTKAWQALERELDAWAAAGRTAAFWWRDDDAAERCSALARLLETSAAAGVAIALAAIPTQLSAEAAADIARTPGTWVLQHGYAHINHAPPQSKKSELGGERAAAMVREELVAGRERLLTLLGAQALPVLVPPWNRIARLHIQRLPEAALTGLSTYGPRAGASPLAGVAQVNTHVDIIDWRGSRDFVGDDNALGQVLAHLRARRAGTVDATEPTGLMTHHKMHEPAAWRFIERLLERSAAHDAARWLDAHGCFAEPVRAAALHREAHA